MLTVAKKPGPQAKAGPRYPCGKRRPSGDVRGLTLWQRIADSRAELIAMGADHKRWASEVGRLHLQAGVITVTQAAAAFMIGEIYGRFEYFEGRSRNARSPDIGSKSPSYELWAATDDHPNWTPGEFQARHRMAVHHWRRLQDQIPHNARAAVEQLCVENRSINPVLYADMAALLEVIAAEFKLRPPPAEKGKPNVRPPEEPRRGARAMARYAFHGPGAVPVPDAEINDPVAAADRLALTT